MGTEMASPQSLETAVPAELHGAARQLFERMGWPPSVDVWQVRPEASRRRYFRVRAAAAEKTATAVLCYDPDLPAQGPTSDFLVIAQQLEAARIPVPERLGIDTDSGLLLLSDAGEHDLQHVLRRGEGAGLLPRAVDLLVDLHSIKAQVPVAARSFDGERLASEIRFLEDALRHVEETFRQTPFFSPEVRFFLRGLCELLGRSGPHVFTHRDFHSRNLMVSTEGRLTVIDFQDARMGLPWYDLSSLLFDPYADHSQATIAEGLTRYCLATDRTGKDHGNLFHAQALQRLFKALGTYVHLTFRGGLAGIYGKSIAPALDRLELATQLGGFPDSIFLFVGDARRRLLPLIAGATEK